MNKLNLENIDLDNVEFQNAWNLIRNTRRSVFLTGKAGTGKSTFLKYICANTSKEHVVLAPTGIAAVNVGGQTLHSFFKIPFKPLLPDDPDFSPRRIRKTLRYSSQKVKLIKKLDLIIIDEISMVRADLLDAIDMVLRRYRRSSRPFGGVQLLMIGDVHQLSPVVTEAEKSYMQQVYPTPYFFASKALQRIPYVTIELTTVYRQQDATFVDLLNHVRDNNIDAETLSKLNARVNAPQQKDAITLTTHNRQADAINRRHMEALKGEQRTFEALLKGNFPEKSLPCDRTLEIKIGERVMFVKNDSSGGHRYYNGMLGTVTGFRYDDEEKKDYIEVVNDDGDTILTGRETWESLRYKLNAKTNEIEQEVEGTFSQYPLQAAWAVTIHKAQGLTFDRVVIDAADAFAFGQVYVALSRCRTLEGLSLSTPLTAGVAFDDVSVSQFVSSQPSFEQTTEAAPEYERQYRLDKLMELFGIDDLMRLVERLQEHYNKLKNIYPEQLSSLNTHISKLLDLQSVSEKFKNQLMRLDESDQNDRARKGAEYYLAQLALFNAHLPALLEVEIDNKETAKNVEESGKELSEALKVKISCLRTVKEKGYSVQAVQKAKVNAMMSDEKKSSKSSKAEKQAGSEDINNDLATLIRQWRAAKAKEEHVPAYNILQQKALHSIATNMPRTLPELKKQLGVGPKTVEKYGKDLLSLVAEYLESGQQYDQ